MPAATTTRLVRTGHPQAARAPLVEQPEPDRGRRQHAGHQQQRQVVVLDLAAARPEGGEHEQARPRHEERAPLPPAERPPAPRPPRPTTWMATSTPDRRHLLHPAEEPHRTEQRGGLAAQPAGRAGGQAERRSAPPASARIVRTRPAASGANSQPSTRAMARRSSAVMLVPRTRRRRVRRGGPVVGLAPRRPPGTPARRPPRRRRRAAGVAHASQISSRSPAGRSSKVSRSRRRVPVGERKVADADRGSPRRASSTARSCQLSRSDGRSSLNSRKPLNGNSSRWATPVTAKHEQERVARRRGRAC